MRVGAAVRRRGRGGPAGQRHRVRPVRLDLDPRRGPGAAGGPRRRGRQPQRQLALLGALLDPVRRDEAVRARPRAGPGRAARVHRRQERLHQRRRSEHVQGRLAGPGRRDHRRGQRHRAGHRAAVRRRGRPGGLRRPRRGGRQGGRRGGRRRVRRRATSPTRRRCATLFDGVAERHGRVDIAFNNAGISPPDDDSILDTGLDAWERVLRVNTTSVYLCCKYAHPAHAAAGQGLDHQHRQSSWR